MPPPLRDAYGGLAGDGDAGDPASYRPISLTSCMAKVMEHMVKARLQQFLEARGLLPPEQAGFRSSRCCVVARGICSVLCAPLCATSLLPERWSACIARVELTRDTRVRALR